MNGLEPILDTASPTRWAQLEPAELAARQRAAGSKRWAAAGEGELALGVADMDLPSPPFVPAALRRSLEHPTLGYHRLSPDVPPAIADWYRRHTGWSPGTDALAVFPFGLKTTIRLVLETLADTAAPTAVLSPIYDGLRRVAAAATAGVVEVPMTRADDGSYELDIDLLRDRIVAGGARTLLLCSPHNPLGRVWTESELTRMAELAAELDLLVVSDEVHGPLTHPDARHVTWPTVARRDRWAVVSSIGKGYNVSGIAGSWLVCGQARNRAPVLRALKAWGHHQGSMLGDAMMAACLSQGDEWLAERVALLSSLTRYAQATLARDSPAIGCTVPHAGYLLWLDLRRVVPASAWSDTAGHLARRAGLVLVDGTRFDPAHRGFARMSVATTWPVLREALHRLGAWGPGHRTAINHG